MTDWPELPFAQWESTCDTVHLWTQIVGKTRLALSPPQNHWWHVPFYVTPRGLTTSPIPFGRRTFDAEFDFIAHQLSIRTSDGVNRGIPFFKRSVADFYREYMSCMHSLGIEVTINPKPQEFDDTTPFDEDHHHASYDREYVERFRRILIGADRVLKIFRSRFLGKSSPVHFFWGSFDLAVTRFSGQLCPPPAPDAKKPDRIMAEAYSHEVISCGFWPGDRRFPFPAFYAYAVPTPPGLDKEPHWNSQLGEFILKYDEAGQFQPPETTILDFCQSAYEAAANLAHWDRQALERAG